MTVQRGVRVNEHIKKALFVITRYSFRIMAHLLLNVWKIVFTFWTVTSCGVDL